MQACFKLSVKIAFDGPSCVDSGVCLWEHATGSASLPACQRDRAARHACARLRLPASVQPERAPGYLRKPQAAYITVITTRSLPVPVAPPARRSCLVSQPNHCSADSPTFHWHDLRPVRCASLGCQCCASVPSSY